MPTPPCNLLQLQHERTEHEKFEDLLCRPGVRIERIISHGHTTPPDEPYVQAWDEWVLVLKGKAELSLQDLGKYTLAPGDCLLIPSGVPHLVTYTEDPTIWLAIHIGEP